MSQKPALNLTVNIELDDDGRPSTDPNHVVKFTQQMLLKAVLEMSNQGTVTPSNLVDLSMLLKDMNTTALTTRKLDQEAQVIGNQKVLVETHKEFLRMFKGQNIYNPDGVEDSRDPYANLTLPSIQVSESEIRQGEQKLNPDDFISED